MAQQLQAEKNRIDQNAIQKQKELTEALAQLKTENEEVMRTKDEQIAHLSLQLEETKGSSQVADFRTEASLVNNGLISQLKLLCQQISLAEPLYELTETINQRVEKARSELDQDEEIISTFLDWQDSEQGKAKNFPRILETHKDILFTEWNSQMMKAERAASRCKITSNNLIELINNTLYLSNMISQCTPGQLTTTNTLEQTCYPDLEKKGRLIAGINSLNMEAYWLFFIKPHSQKAALKCLIEAVSCILPDIQDATYAAQLSSRLNKPLEVEPMLAISQLRFKGKQPT